MKEPRILSTVLILTINVMVAVNCSSSYTITAQGIPVEEAYSRDTGGANLRYMDGRSPLYQKKKVPVIFPPKVFGCYVPSHVDNDMDILIGEHWVFFKVAESSWYVDNNEKTIGFDTQNIGDADKLVNARLFLAENLRKGMIPID